MIPAAFDYEVADSVTHAVELLGSRDDTKLLAGGHSLLPLLKLRVVRPSLLVDVGRLTELSYIRDDGAMLTIGALTRHHDLVTDALAREHAPLLSGAAAQIGDPQVRHRGTIGGSASHGDPASDLPTCLLALDAEFLVVGAGTERFVPAAEFFTGVFTTAVGPQEMLTAIRVPTHGDAGTAYVKFRRRAQDWATVGVAVVTRNGGGAIALTNMGPTPLRARTAEAALAEGAVAAGEGAAAGTSPPDDVAASAEFRKHLARVLTRRAVEQALAG
jgi:aerobic carbon-monoxide dehydrogenase medium subunit